MYERKTRDCCVEVYPGDEEKLNRLLSANGAKGVGFFDRDDAASMYCFFTISHKGVQIIEDNGYVVHDV